MTPGSTSRSVLRLRRFGVLATALLAVGCGGSGQRGSAFVFLSVDFFSLDGTTPVAAVRSTPARDSTTSACVTLRNNLKNPTVTAPTALDNVIVQSYTVTVRGADGGVLVGPFTIATGVLVPAGVATSGIVSGNTATFPVVLVPAGSKVGTSGLPGSAQVEFRGRDGRGVSVRAEGAVAVEFANGTDASCSATGTGTTTGGGTGTTGGTTGTTTGTTGTTGS
ncbi:MAG TPA: hypothetical protein VFC42_07695 [Methylomirabilota bacterium]|jgi:hypothetical protein|nr:hypothetical protein [Methylomirabilota bacterium]